ncbi:MAG: DUF933 domain-containing protein [Fimbriimonadaceae bacterium]
MKVGLIGYAQSGKSTLYRAAAKGQAKGDVTVVPVPDPRFDAIVAQVKPKKATPAGVTLHDDIESMQAGGKTLTQRALDAARKMDLLLHVVRGFDSPMSPYHAEIDPLRDEENVSIELVLTDLQIVENRLERLAKSQDARRPGTTEYLERVLFEHIKEPLEEGRPIRSLELSDDDAIIVRNYQFLTAKPMVVAFNLSEGGLTSPGPKIESRIAKLAETQTPAFVVSAPIEEEVANLEPADQPEFLQSLGLAAPAGDRVIQAVYQALGLITFYTAGENETRAWPLRKGANALKAAATIHTDIARGFIRAEVVHYEDYEAAGSLDAAYSAGKMTLEGKEYVIRDGDLLHIRNKA